MKYGLLCLSVRCCNLLPHKMQGRNGINQLTAVTAAGFDKRMLAVPLALTVLFYAWGVHRSTRVQDDFLKEHYDCHDDDTCRVKFSFGAAISLLWLNFIVAAT